MLKRLKDCFCSQSMIFSLTASVLVLNLSTLFISDLAAQGGMKDRLIDEALKINAVQRGDLSIRSDLYTNPFALRHFRRWMDNPMNAPGEAQAKAMSIFAKCEDPLSWIKELAMLGDLNIIGPIPLKKYDRHEFTAPWQLKEAICLILDAIYTANLRLGALKAEISSEDISLIESLVLPEACIGRDSEGKTERSLGLSEQRQAIAVAENVNREDIFAAGLTIIGAVVKAKELLTKTDKWQKEVSSFSFMTDLGKVEIGGIGPDVHQDAATLIIDLGGNDIYKGKIASGINGKCSLVLDLGGDDLYVGEDCTQGSGVWGIGILYDLDGNDLYRAGSCSQGAGLFGLGMIIDGGGIDTYLGTKFVQAASSWGWGGLIDLGGEDTYSCQHSGQAYSGVLGVSCLCDVKGNDKYLSGFRAPDPREPDMNKSFSQGFSSGIRNLAAGGFAILADKSGNDLYQCQYFGQGSSYWMGIGVLYDETGKDTYVARRYAQGAGIHFSFGLLMDAAGNDHISSWGVSQGCGHDYGIGILINEAGNDTYVSDWLSMGASQANGVGIFVDNSGDDGYESNTGMAVGNFIESRRSGGIGLFIDADGKDRYSMNGANNTVWGMNRWSIGIDGASWGMSGINIIVPAAATIINEEAEKEKREEKNDLARRLEISEEMPYPLNIKEMISVASHWGFEKEIPREAGEKLLSLPPERSTPVVVEFISTPSIMTLIFMERFFKIHAFHAMSELVRKIRNPDPVAKLRAFYFLGLLKDSRVLEYFVEGLNDPSWKIRSAAVRAIGEALNIGRLKVLVPMMQTFDEALAQNNPDIIKRYLGNDDSKVNEMLSVVVRTIPLEYKNYKRYAEMSSIKKKEKIVNDFVAFLSNNLDKILPVLERWVADINHSSEISERLMPTIVDLDPAVRKSAAYSLGQMNYRPAIPEIIALLKDPHLWVRDTAVLSLALFQDEALYPLAQSLRRESPPFRILAMDVLAQIKSKQSKTLVERYLDDADEGVRRAARKAFSSL
jgi:HEAT repeat protein